MNDQEEEFHVTLDFLTESPDLSQPYELIGLETAHPILKIDQQTFRGTWTSMVGTEMLFDEKGEWLMNVQKRLRLQPVELIRKGNEKRGVLKSKFIREEDLVEERKSGAHGSETPEVTMETHRSMDEEMEEQNLTATMSRDESLMETDGDIL